MYVPNENFADTDDDLPPPSHQNRVPRGSHVTGNGRSAVGSVPFLRMHSDMEAEIHHLEQEAYYSVLRAFKAQSNAITWVFTFLYFKCFYYPYICLFSSWIIWLCHFMFIHQEKEEMITELRKELRVSDDEHRELLTKVNADDIIRKIRFDCLMKPLQLKISDKTSSS